MNKFNLLFFTLLLFIIIFNCFMNSFQEDIIEGLENNQGALPTTITKDNFNQYFEVDKGISNCKGRACPEDVTNYITKTGEIVWKNGKSVTFRTRDNISVLPSGIGFVGFQLNSVPMGEKIWNSIWLMGK